MRYVSLSQTPSFSESKQLRVTLQGNAYLVTPVNVSSDVFAEDPFWSRLPYAKFGIAASTA